MADVLSLPDHLRQIVNWMIRSQKKEFTLTDVAANIGETEELTYPKLEILVAQGFLQKTGTEDNPIYHFRLVSKPAKRKLPGKIWQALE
ncbi:hypothetical protein ACE1CC_07570 [Aerosakkonemataceae cyanobacterium BLCC-F46]|uniref:Uncharacterized protein n=2 Tax=Floridanema TaxID=3396149 RepID=A0ABV4X1T8_9CYAN